MKIYFTSDLHFGHARVIQYCKRPFSSADGMDQALISNWNSVVTNSDNIYVVGDVSFHRDQARTDEILRQLNGTKFLVFGNHDRHLRGPLLKHFEWSRDLVKIRVQDPTLDHGFQPIVLCHYALRVWEQSHYGCWHLYGHSHGTLPDDPNALSCDVGVDCWNYTPVSYEQLKGRMAQKTWKPIDHHDPERRRKTLAEE